MQTTKTTKAATKAVAKKAPARKPAPKQAAESKAAEKPKLTHYHREHNLSPRHYLGASGYINENRVTAVKPDNYPRTPETLTQRTLGAFHAIRDAYGEKPFPARGLDNAIIAMLLTAGLITRQPGTGRDTHDKNGAATIADAPGNPAQFAVAAKFKSYGNATK